MYERYFIRKMYERLLEYFGDWFDRYICKRSLQSCDNCEMIFIISNLLLMYIFILI